MAGRMRDLSNLTALLTASGTTIMARLGRMAADPHGVAKDPETTLMVTEKLAAITEAAGKAMLATPALTMAWQRWWWQRALSFDLGAVQRADHELTREIQRVMARTAHAMQTPFRRRARANARRLSA